ncbi:MAG: oligosaccharide flippase family protein [Bacteroidetes bacterium]|nr:oligosaccharide flippase family protein [Bacteroidota bacterium]
MNPFKKLASQTAIYGLPTIVGRLLNYLLVPLYTNVFSPSEYGVVTELYAYVSFLGVLLTYGMETALFRFSENKDDKEKVFSTSLISIFTSSAVFIFFILIFLHPLAKSMRYETHPEYILWFAIIIVLDAVTAIPFAKLRQANRPKAFALIKSSNIFLNILFNLFFIVFCSRVYSHPDSSFYPLVSKIYSPQIGVGYIFISNLLASIATLLMLLPGLLNVKYKLDKPLLKRMLIYAIPLLIAGLAGMVNETMDRILLKYLLPASSNIMAQIGIYGACYKVSIIMTIFIQTFRYAAEPFFFAEARNKDASEIYAHVMKYFVIACCLIFLGTLLYMDIVKYFVGEKFREGLFIVPILLLANLCLGIFFNLSIWYKLSGQTKYGAYLTILGAIITIAANYFWIPIWGYAGAAWATLACYASIMLASYFIGQRFYYIKYDIKRILGYLLGAILIYFISTTFSTFSLSLRLILNTILLLSFCGIAYYLEKDSFQLKNATSHSNEI